jgi:peptide-methionine (S)-S-oxide reductase
MNRRLQKSSTIAGIVALVLMFLFFRACRPVAHGEVMPLVTNDSLEHATFAMGCFWHSEEIFLEIKGVKEALPGYCGGTEANPSYEMVGSGDTRYAESVDVAFDPNVTSYEKLLEVFFAEHDPTTPNRQGNDEGPQYRSAVFYHNSAQKLAVDTYLAKLRADQKYSSAIVTQVAPYDKFYRAEDYHLRYFRKHPGQPYIEGVTRPEVEHFRKDFPELLK